jgi:hypothetical protein
MWRMLYVEGLALLERAGHMLKIIPLLLDYTNQVGGNAIRILNSLLISGIP